MTARNPSRAAKAQSRHPAHAAIPATGTSALPCGALGEQPRHDLVRGRVMSTTAELVQKCARALALMEQAQRLVDEVLDDPGYTADPKPRGWPEGVCPDGVPDCLPGAIAMLTPGWGDDG
jgi:hypothetical protein